MQVGISMRRPPQPTATRLLTAQPSKKSVPTRNPAADLRMEDPSSVDTLPSAIVRIECTPTVVNVIEPYKSGEVVRQVGTGCVVPADFDGRTDVRLVLTCYHVIDGSRDADIKVYISSLGRARAFPAAVRGLLPEHDLALLVVRIDDPSVAQGVRAVAVGDSDDVRPGCRVAIGGFPLGVTHAKISTGEIAGTHGGLLQTTAAVNPGNSGGPAVCTDRDGQHGRLVGVVTSKIAASAASNIAFCVPSRVYSEHAMRMLATQGVTHALRFGVCYQSRPAVATSPEGVVVTHLHGRSELAATVRVGDIVSDLTWPLAAGGTAHVRITNSGEATGVPGHPPGTTVPFDEALARVPEGARATFSVRSGPSEAARHVTAARAVPMTGVLRMAYTPHEPWDSTRAFGMCFVQFRRNLLERVADPRIVQSFLALQQRAHDADWVIVSACAPNSVAYDVGLRPGLLVATVNGRGVSTVREMRAALCAISADGIAIAFRGGKSIQMCVRDALAEEQRLCAGAYEPDPALVRAWSTASTVAAAA